MEFIHEETLLGLADCNEHDSGSPLPLCAAKAERPAKQDQARCTTQANFQLDDKISCKGPAALKLPASRSPSVLSVPESGQSRRHSTAGGGRWRQRRWPAHGLPTHPTSLTGAQRCLHIFALQALPPAAYTRRAEMACAAGRLPARAQPFVDARSHRSVRPTRGAAIRAAAGSLYLGVDFGTSGARCCVIDE